MFFVVSLFYFLPLPRTWVESSEKGGKEKRAMPRGSYSNDGAEDTLELGWAVNDTTNVGDLFCSIFIPDGHDG
jgi:hypothetical protein